MPNTAPAAAEPKTRRFPTDAQPPANARYGVLPPEKLRELDGMELFGGIMRGEIAGAPIAEGMNMWVHEAEPGRVVFAARPQLRHYNPIGSVHGGFFGTMMDSAMSCAIHTTLKKGIGYTTLEFRVHLIRAITDKTGPVFCEGRAVNVGRQVGTAEGHLYDADGKLYAHGTTTCLIFPMPG